MNRQQKALLIDYLKQEFTECPGSFLIGYQGMTVADMQTLRKELRQAGSAIKVAKNRLARRAIDGLEGASELSPLLKQQLGIVFAHKDPAATAKLLHDFSKKKNTLKLVAGCVERELLTKEDVVILAQLPPREVLLAQLLGTMQAPIATYARLLHALLARLLYVTQAIADKKAAEENN
jgi:large subunit ribosomal protein L10